MTVPNTPGPWKALYSGDSFPTLPGKEYSSPPTKDSFVQRNLFIDGSLALANHSSFLRSIYADVFALPSVTRLQFPPGGGGIQIFSRLIATDGNALTFSYDGPASDMCLLSVFHTQSTFPLSYSVNGRPPVVIQPPARTAGFSITFLGGNASVTYFPAYDEVDLREGADLYQLLATQLRASNLLFWLRQTYALAVTNHVSIVTSNSMYAAAVNLQSNTLLNQLNADAVRGTRTEYAELAYAPALTIDTYFRALNGAIDTAGAFQAQYDRFVDKASSIAIQAQAWDTMLQRSQDLLATQVALAQQAYDKFQSAVGILTDCENASKLHQLILGDASRDFRLGLAIWEREQLLKQVLTGIKVAFSIAILATGEPAAIGDIFETVVEAAENINEIAKISETVRQLQNVVETLNTLWAATLKTVETMMQIKNNPDWDVSASAGGDQAAAVLVAITGIAAWDVWRLEVEDAIQAAVDEGIGGASAYLLELRKHSINGKLLCMARAEAVKAAQEYSELQMSVWVTRRDTARLQALRDQFQNDQLVAIKASEYFWDRLMLHNTGVLTMMRNAIWAYRYYALRDSTVVLSPLKTIADYKADSQTLQSEVINWQEGFSSAPSPYEFPRTAADLPLNYGPAVIAALKAKGLATFTLNPPPELAGPFVGGGRFRTVGLRAFLDGAVPKVLSSDGSGVIALSIKTSGLYHDVLRGKFFAFTRRPIARAFSYRLSRTGLIQIEVDSFVPSDVWADPTPLTQWTIAVAKPETVDLSGLTNVRLEWKGNAYFDAKRDQAAVASNK